MKNICNNCGNSVPDTEKVCPRCGAPLANAASDADKKFWERDVNNGVQPPSPPQSQPSAPTPPKYNPATGKKRNFKWAAIIALVTVAIIVLFLAFLLIKTVKDNVKVTYNTTRIETKQMPNGGTITTVVNNSNIDSAQMQQISQQMMQQMNEMDSMMNAMMAGDPFAELEQMMGAMNGSETPRHATQVPVQRVKRATGGVAKMAGRIGDKDYVLVFDYKDPQNVKGSGRQVQSQSTVRNVQLLGILGGNTLTMTIYPTGSKTPEGTISASFDGSMLQGSYMRSDGQGQEQQVLFYEQ